METKEVCINILNKLDIYKPYITGFKAKAEKVCFFEEFAGFWLYQEPEIMEKMKSIEADRDCKIYAVTHEYTSIGEMWDFLMVPNDETEYNGDEDIICEQLKPNLHRLWSMTWNKTEDFVEEGDVLVASFGGGIKRVG